MAASAATEPAGAPARPGPASPPRVRVLGLGNDLLADDALGILVARRLRDRRPDLDVVDTIEAGLALLDSMEGADRLIVVDTIRDGSAPPGSVRELTEGDLAGASGPSPHYVGLLEALAAGRALGLRVPREVAILAVEAHDCLTVGGTMHPAVEAAVDEVVRRVERMVP